MPVPNVLLGIASKAAQAAASKAVEMAKDPEVQAKMKDAAKKAWDNKDEIKEAATPLVKKATERTAAAGSKAAGLVGGAASGVAKAAGNVTDSASSAVKAQAEKRAQEKALIEARQQLLQSATAKMKAADFEAEWEKSLHMGGIAPLKSPGYFVIATYKGKPSNDKLYDYKDVFVARAENMGASIHRHLCGQGNPDVYADMKYGQNMLVLAFPDFDFEDDNNETLCQFISALDADDSYNGRIADSFAQEASVSIGLEGALAHVDRVGGILEGAFGAPVAAHHELCGNNLKACSYSFRLNN